MSLEITLTYFVRHRIYEFKMMVMLSESHLLPLISPQTICIGHYIIRSIHLHSFLKSADNYHFMKNTYGEQVFYYCLLIFKRSLKENGNVWCDFTPDFFCNFNMTINVFQRNKIHTYRTHFWNTPQSMEVISRNKQKIECKLICFYYLKRMP